jgi:hypothetical protein
VTGPIRDTFGERAYDVFVESPTRTNKTAVEVSGTLTSSSGPFSPPANSDAIARSVAGPVETFEYFTGGLAGTLVKTITVTYTNATLEDLVSVEVS